MSSKNEAISVRSSRLNQIILGNEVSTKIGRGVQDCLNRESLLDALTVLYNECHKETQKSNNDKQFVEFVNKCKYRQTD